jgi:hypothetical protein
MRALSSPVDFLVPMATTVIPKSWTAAMMDHDFTTTLVGYPTTPLHCDMDDKWDRRRLAGIRLRSRRDAGGPIKGLDAYRVQAPK